MGLKPVPTLYCNIESISKSLLTSQTTVRVAPRDRSTLEDENSKFCNINRNSNFENLNGSLCPTVIYLKKIRMKRYFTNITPFSTFNSTSV